MNRIRKLTAATLASAALALAGVGLIDQAGASAPRAPGVINLANGGTHTDAVAIGDLNRDRIPDVVSTATGLGVAVSLGEGHHRFAPTRTYAPPADLLFDPCCCRSS